MRELRPSPQRPEGCFRSLLLVTCPYLCLAKALVPDLQPTDSGDAKYRRVHLGRTCYSFGYQHTMTKAPLGELQLADQQLMAEAPWSRLAVHDRQQTKLLQHPGI